MKKKFHGTQRGAGEDHSAAGEALVVAANPRSGFDCAYFISGAAVDRARQWFDVHDPGFGEDLRSVFFRQIQVADVESIFCAVAAAHHAAAAGDASGSRRAFTVEVRVWVGLIARLSIFRLENAD